MPVLVSRQKKEFNEFNKNMKWFHDNYEELRGAYAGQYVAVNKGKVVMNSKDAKALIKSLREKYGDIGAFVIEFVRKEKFELIL